ncbi:hypothetical protein [Halorhodospira halophila]|uniref:hypothetical protein n=1 Tax=Halorhodospira halophila TaxID=1053 RepID=UPI001911D312|nr:hypothetical protein [Halorhodospira halophila]MBK5942701.1 hypothetical protein [Halorhodospira halophila]
MSFGFTAVNDAGQVLVSSDSRTLHHLGEATYLGQMSGFNTHGGYRRFGYEVRSPVAPMPFFTMPTSDYYGIASIRESSSGIWHVEIIRSGTGSARPEVHAFADVRAFAEPDEGWGMVVYDEDGGQTFDSRLQPLIITDTTMASPPSGVLGSAISGLSAKHCRSSNSSAGNQLQPTEQNRYWSPEVESEPAYFFSSMAQTYREGMFEDEDEYCEDIDAYGECVGRMVYEAWVSVYWAFYRSGIRRNGDYLEAGWITVDFGCVSDYEEETTFGIGGLRADFDDYSYRVQQGLPPYTDETLNTFDVPILRTPLERYR